MYFLVFSSTIFRFIIFACMRVRVCCVCVCCVYAKASFNVHTQTRARIHSNSIILCTNLCIFRYAKLLSHFIESHMYNSLHYISRREKDVAFFHFRNDRRKKRICRININENEKKATARATVTSLSTKNSNINDDRAQQRERAKENE